MTAVQASCDTQNSPDLDTFDMHVGLHKNLRLLDDLCGFCEVLQTRDQQLQGLRRSLAETKQKCLALPEDQALQAQDHDASETTELSHGDIPDVSNLQHDTAQEEATGTEVVGGALEGLW